MTYRSNIQDKPDGSLGFYHSRTSEIEGDVYTPMMFCPRCRMERPQLKTMHTALNGHTFDCIKCSQCNLIFESKLYKELNRNIGRVIFKPPKLEHD